MKRKLVFGLIFLLILAAVPLISIMAEEKDITPPVVTGLDEKIYNNRVTPIFNEGEAVLNGSVFRSETTIDEDGEYVLEVKDRAGNMTMKEFVIDSTSPAIPELNEISDQSVEITGKAEPGSSITIRSETEMLASGQADESARFTVALTPQKAGTEIIIVSTDDAGNKSEASTTIKDKTPPNTPVVNEISNEDTELSGKADSNSTIIVMTGEKKIGETAVKDKGIFNLKIDKLKAGLDITVYAIDAAGNSSGMKTVSVEEVVSITPVPQTTEYESARPAKVESVPVKEADKVQVEVREAEVQPTYINGILVVNKKYGLPSTYAPGINGAAQSALHSMLAAAKVAGHELSIISDFRSYDYQEGLYNRYVSTHGQAQANRFSAPPGHSEHQTGLAFDLGGANDQSHWLKASFGETPEGKWLAQNAHNYGFIIRYLQGKESVTGYMYEPWHFRHLGVDNAIKVYNSGLTLEEYLGIHGN